VFLNRQRKLRYFLCTTASSAAPQIPYTVSADAGIEPRTVATLALAFRRSNRSDLIQPKKGITAAAKCCVLKYLYGTQYDLRRQEQL
jgi:hypothetical protein